MQFDCERFYIKKLVNLEPQRDKLYHAVLYLIILVTHCVNNDNDIQHWDSIIAITKLKYLCFWTCILKMTIFK